MKRLWCWLTGGHRYSDANLESLYNPYTEQTVLSNRCVKCGKGIAITVDTHTLVKREMDEFAKRRGLYVRASDDAVQNTYRIYGERKDGDTDA